MTHSPYQPAGTDTAKRSMQPSTAWRAEAASTLSRSPGWRRTFSALGNRHYRTLWFAELASLSALQMAQIARGWLTAQISGDRALALGIVSLAWGLPQLAFALIGGAVADRFDKRTIMIASQAVMGVLALLNAILVHAGVIQIWHLFVLGLFQGTVFSFNAPARQALAAELLGERELMNGIAMLNSARNMTRIAAPSVGGVLIALPFIGLTGVFYLIAAFYLAVLANLVQLPRMQIHRGRVQESMLKEIGAGLHYIQVSPTLLTLITLAFVMTILGMPYMTLLPIFARTVHHVGSEGLGLMSTVAGVGALIGSLAVATMADHPRKPQLQALAGITFGVVLFLFAAAPNFPIALFGLTLMGFMHTSFMAINNTLVMMHTTPEYHGRVLSVYMMSWSFMPIASLPMSMLADHLGAPVTLSAAGLLIAIIILVVVLLTRRSQPVAMTPAPADAGPRSLNTRQGGFRQ